MDLMSPSLTRPQPHDSMYPDSAIVSYCFPMTSALTVDDLTISATAVCLCNDRTDDLLAEYVVKATIEHPSKLSNTKRCLIGTTYSLGEGRYR